MSEADEQYIEGLREIRNARQLHRKNLKILSIASFLGAALSLAFPAAAVILVLAVVLYWYSFFKTAGFPCPRCHEAFASNWVFPMGYDANQCQNCKLCFDMLDKHEGNTPDSHTKEWFE